MRIECLLAAVLLLVGCVRSLEPIIEPGQAVDVPGLEGTWTGVDGKESSPFKVIAHGNSFKLVGAGEDGKPEAFRIVVGRVGEMLIADVTPDSPEGRPPVVALMIPVHMPVRIMHTSPRLGIKLLKDQWFMDYIKTHPGELATIERDGPLIVASTAQIQEFLARHAQDDKAWEDEQNFRRVDRR